MAGVALLVVDMQPDFCEGGKLVVPHALELIDPINELMLSPDWDIVVATKDWHPPDHVSFASNHQGAKVLDQCEIFSTDGSQHLTTTLWPVHTIQHTPGAELCSGLDTRLIDYIVTKGEGTESYSAFSDVFHEQYTKLQGIFQRHAITEVVLVGLGLDFCVGNTALDAVRLGYKTTIYQSLVLGVYPESSSAMTTKLQSAGVIFR